MTLVEPHSPEFHITYGLHSGYPICCVFQLVEEGEHGECPKCKEKGMSYDLHRCSVDIPACAPYLELIADAAVKNVHRFADEDNNDIAFGHSTELSGKVLSALEERGYKLQKTEEQGSQTVRFYSRFSR